jgi:hypothetical protein
MTGYSEVIARQGLPFFQKSSHRDPHRKAGQPSVALMLYTQQFWLQKRSDLKFCLQSAK